MEYRDIPGYKYAYRCTDDGQFFVDHGHGKGWEPVAIISVRYGMRKINVVRKDGVSTSRGVNRLMWEAFRGELKQDECVTKRDGCVGEPTVWDLVVASKAAISSRCGKIGKRTNRVKAIGKDRRVIAVYESQKDAAKAGYMTRQAMGYRLRKDVAYQLEHFGIAYKRVKK